MPDSIIFVCNMLLPKRGKRDVKIINRFERRVQVTQLDYNSVNNVGRNKRESPDYDY